MIGPRLTECAAFVVLKMPLLGFKRVVKHIRPIQNYIFFISLDELRVAGACRWLIACSLALKMLIQCK